MQNINKHLYTVDETKRLLRNGRNQHLKLRIFSFLLKKTDEHACIDSEGDSDQEYIICGIGYVSFTEFHTLFQNFKFHPVRGEICTMRLILNIG